MIVLSKLAVDNKKTWTNNFVYAFEVSPNTIAPYPSKSPRRSVSVKPLLLVLFQFGDFQKQEYELTLSVFMSFSSYLIGVRFWIMLQR